MSGRRPVGTDGSDYSYRMVIESRYKNMATFRKYAKVFFYLQFLIVGVKLAWSMAPFLQGQQPPYWVYIMPAAEIIAVILYQQGGMGGNKESMTFLMLYNVILGIMAVLHVILTYVYYTLPPFTHFAYILAAEFSGLKAREIGHWFKLVEYCIDSFTFMILIGGALYSQLYVSSKSAAASKRA
eukprot:TRINITY_DN971_c0_g1_i2.p1 TRINITY_DN971_c0_g1~~TRINITY_DN971_c0_g1_i2.p1  ORF type:complete len:183 (+),score=4.03 TRINITY_DN971_c0_g1_i2:88-636(+)